MPVYGESEHQLDDKGRINIPRKFQSLFEHGGFLARAFNGQSLVFYPSDIWNDIQRRLGATDFTELSADDIARYLGCGVDTQLDGQGRLSIPPTLRRRGKLEKDVTLIAMGHKIEIWDTESWIAYDEARLTPSAMEQALKEIQSRRSASE